MGGAQQVWMLGTILGLVWHGHVKFGGLVQPMLGMFWGGDHSEQEYLKRCTAIYELFEV